MAEDKPESFVARWSRRKHAAARETTVPGAAPETAPPPAAALVAAAEPVPAAPAAPELPPVESLTFESDFSQFMRPDVVPDVRQAALRKLLRDPRFNTMDGLDVYIDDYTKPSPLDPRIAERLAKALFTPTRVNAQGHAEDVPPDEREPVPPAAAADAPPEPPQVAGVEPPAGQPADVAPPVPRGDPQ